MALGLALGIVPSEAPGATITAQSFDTDPPLAASAGPGVWYVDRYPPAVFDSAEFMGDRRLRHGISAADGAAGRPPGNAGSFYNTQGRAFDTPGAVRLAVDFYADPDFATDPGRIGGLWGTARDAANAISGFPILEFAGGTFQAFDSVDDDDDGAGFRTIGLPAGFSYGRFYRLGLEIDRGADLFRFLIDGTVVWTEEAAGTAAFGNAILQNVNTSAGLDRTIYWDEFHAATVPLPAGVAGLLAALGGLALLAARRRQS